MISFAHESGRRIAGVPEVASSWSASGPVTLRTEARPTRADLEPEGCVRALLPRGPRGALPHEPIVVVDGGGLFERDAGNWAEARPEDTERRKIRIVEFQVRRVSDAIENDTGAESQVRRAIRRRTRRASGSGGRIRC